VIIGRPAAASAYRTSPPDARTERPGMPPGADGAAPDPPGKGSPLRTVSLCALLMLMVVPVWNAMLLLRSEVYGYFIGAGPPACLVALCLLLLLSWAVVARGVSVQADAARVLGFTGSGLLTVLGLGCMICGQACLSRAAAAANDVLTDCLWSETSAPLVKESQLLHVLRMIPACASEPTVRSCSGYIESSEARVLAAIESDLRCSMFCHSATEAAPRQTLYSSANYRASCQMMVVRDLESRAGDICSQMYFEGCLLVLCAALLSLLTLVNGCAALPVRLKAQVGEYGSLQRLLV